MYRYSVHFPGNPYSYELGRFQSKAEAIQHVLDNWEDHLDLDSDISLEDQFEVFTSSKQT